VALAALGHVVAELVAAQLPLDPPEGVDHSGDLKAESTDLHLGGPLHRLKLLLVRLVHLQDHLLQEAKDILVLLWLDL